MLKGIKRIERIKRIGRIRRIGSIKKIKRIKRKVLIECDHQQPPRNSHFEMSIWT